MRKNVTSRLEQITKLEAVHERRMRVLELKAANSGTHTDAEIITEIEDIKLQLVALRAERDEIEQTTFIVANQLKVKENQFLFIQQNQGFANLLREMIIPLIAVIVLLIAMWVTYIMTGWVEMGGFVALCVTVLFCVLGRH